MKNMVCFYKTLYNFIFSIYKLTNTKIYTSVERIITTKKGLRLLKTTHRTSSSFFSVYLSTCSSICLYVSISCASRLSRNTCRLSMSIYRLQTSTFPLCLCNLYLYIYRPDRISWNPCLCDRRICRSGLYPCLPCTCCPCRLCIFCLSRTYRRTCLCSDRFCSPCRCYVIYYVSFLCNNKKKISFK